MKITRYQIVWKHSRKDAAPYMTFATEAVARFAITQWLFSDPKYYDVVPVKV